LLIKKSMLGIFQACDPNVVVSFAHAEIKVGFIGSEFDANSLCPDIFERQDKPERARDGFN